MANLRGYLRWASVLTGLAVVSVAGFLAVDRDGLFELGDGHGTPGSGDVVGSDTQDGCDWGDLFDADPTEEEIAAAVAACGGIDAVFIADPLSQRGSKDDTVFGKGSSKNDDPIATWRWTTGNTPAKDDLSNVYTYATVNDSGELIVYAGLERLAPNGDSHVDFEFNQDVVGLDRDPPCSTDGSAGPDDGPPCEFTGGKMVNDLLVVTDFKKGGDLGFVEIRRWNGTDYVLMESFGGEGCDGADTVCVFNNAMAIDGGAWDSYDSHGNPISMLEANAFTEAGINVTRLFGETPCFVSVQTKSRSSASFSSALKDFAQGSFSICSLEIDKTGIPEAPELSKIGDDFVFRYTISNTGGATLYLISVIDSFLGDITDEARGAGFTEAIEGTSCAVLAPASRCSFDISAAIPEDADDPFVTNVMATYGPSASLALDAEEMVISVSDSDDFPLELFQPSVAVTKTGDALSTPGNVVRYHIDIVNTGSVDSPPLVIGSDGFIDDTLLGDLLDPTNPYVTASTCTSTLPTGAGCAIDAARTVRADDPDPLPNTVSVMYHPEGFPNEIRGSDDHAVDLVYPGFSFTVTAIPATAFVGDTITYTFAIVNTGDVDLNEIRVVDTLLGDLSPLFPDVLVPGESATITVTRVVLETDPDPVVNQTTATYQVGGLPNQITRTASFSVDRLVPCALSPGFWKGGSGVPKWDDILTDWIAQAAGFDTGTVFPWLDPSLVGSTYLDVLELSALGDVTRQLSFKYVAARLNEATFGVRSDTAALLDDVDRYFMAHPVGSDPQGAAQDEGQALLNAVNAYFTETGEGNCPPPATF